MCKIASSLTGFINHVKKNYIDATFCTISLGINTIMRACARFLSGLLDHVPVHCNDLSSYLVEIDVLSELDF